MAEQVRELWVVEINGVPDIIQRHEANADRMACLTGGKVTRYVPETANAKRRSAEMGLEEFQRSARAERAMALANCALRAENEKLRADLATVGWYYLGKPITGEPAEAYPVMTPTEEAEARAFCDTIAAMEELEGP